MDPCPTLIPCPMSQPSTNKYIKVTEGYGACWELIWVIWNPKRAKEGHLRPKCGLLGRQAPIKRSVGLACVTVWHHPKWNDRWQLGKNLVPLEIPENWLHEVRWGEPAQLSMYIFILCLLWERCVEGNKSSTSVVNVVVVLLNWWRKFAPRVTNLEGQFHIDFFLILLMFWFWFSFWTTAIVNANGYSIQVLTFLFLW